MNDHFKWLIVIVISLFLSGDTNRRETEKKTHQTNAIYYYSKSE